MKLFCNESHPDGVHALIACAAAQPDQRVQQHVLEALIEPRLGEVVYPIAGEVAELIDLIADPKRRGQRLDDRIIRVLDIDGNFLSPGMAVEIGADQVSVIRPGVERVGGRMDAAASFAVPHKRQQIGLLLMAQFQLAAGEEVEDSEICKLSAEMSERSSLQRTSNRPELVPICCMTPHAGVMARNTASPAPS